MKERDWPTQIGSDSSFLILERSSHSSQYSSLLPNISLLRQLLVLKGSATLLVNTGKIQLWRYIIQKLDSDHRPSCILQYTLISDKVKNFHTPSNMYALSLLVFLCPSSRSLICSLSPFLLILLFFFFCKYSMYTWRMLAVCPKHKLDRVGECLNPF